MQRLVRLKTGARRCFALLFMKITIVNFKIKMVDNGGLSLYNGKELK